MKRKLLIGMVLLLVSSLALVGCPAGVSQEEYDAVVAERDAAQAQVVTLEADVAEAQAQVAELEANAAQAAAYAEFMVFWMGGSQLETEEEMQAYDAEMQSRLEALDDAELSTMVADMMEDWATMMAEGLSQEEIMMASMELIMGIESHILGKIVEALGVEQ
jgi:predicted  nucleic acid-binding Zn-ribbon protein